MSFPLYQALEQEEAIISFAQIDIDRFFEGQLVVAPKQAWGFFCLDEVTRFNSPTQLTWYPPLSRDSVSQAGDILKRILGTDVPLFVRSDTGKYLYIGPAFVWSCCNDGTNACFELRNKLNREIWLRLGGYDGWEVKLDHERHTIREHDEKKFEAVLNQMKEQPLSHLVLTRYEEDEFHAFLNEHCGWLMYLRYPGDPGLYIKPKKSSLDINKLEIFKCDCGIDLELKAESTISRADAVQAAHEFFRTGALPTHIVWGEQ